MLCGTKPFCSVILHTGLAAQQIQKTSAWRPWGKFCSLNTLGTAAVTLDRSLRPAPRSQETDRVAPLTSPCFTEGRCIQLLTTCGTGVLPGGCSRVLEMRAMARAHPERCWAAGAGRLTSLVPPAPVAVKGSRDCSAEGAKREQLEGLSTVLVHPLNLSKGRREADAGGWS